MAVMLRAAEVRVGTEVIIHSALAEGFTDHYVTILDVGKAGFAVVLDVRDRTGREGEIVVDADTACTVYGALSHRVSPNGVDHLIVNGHCATCGGDHADWK